MTEIQGKSILVRVSEASSYQSGVDCIDKKIQDNRGKTTITKAGRLQQSIHITAVTAG